MAIFHISSFVRVTFLATRRFKCIYIRVKELALTLRIEFALLQTQCLSVPQLYSSAEGCVCGHVCRGGKVMRCWITFHFAQKYFVVSRNYFDFCRTWTEQYRWWIIVKIVCCPSKSSHREAFQRNSLKIARLTIAMNYHKYLAPWHHDKFMEGGMGIGEYDILLYSEHSVCVYWCCFLLANKFSHTLSTYVCTHSTMWYKYHRLYSPDSYRYSI